MIPQRRPVIAGNWKMNKTASEAIELVNGLKRNLYDQDSIEIVVCPPFTALSEVSEVLGESNIGLGAQNLFWELKGAYTGEISVLMLKELGCRYCIIGHSERRQYFGETDESVAKKVRRTLDEKLIPILCVGERLKEREENKTFEVIRQQIVKGLSLVSKSELSLVMIAYEPVWAIGTGRNATPQQAQEVHIYVRTLVGELFDKDFAIDLRIQYGGSVNPDNIAQLMKEPDVDGALVGGASLSVDSFVHIVKTTRQVYHQLATRHA